MEFDVEKSPFQKVMYDEATITVDAQPASIPRIGNIQPLCENYPLQHKAYRMYMPEQDSSNETYFLSIASMLTVQDMKKNGDFVPVPVFGSPMRRVYSAYPGTGSVFGMLTYFSNTSSAYVPIVSYGCDATTWSSSCFDTTFPFAKVLLGVVFFVGLFVSMRGFYYFRTSMFLMAMLAGGYVGYALSVYSGAPDFTGLMLTTILAGVVTSLVWLLLWTTFSSPIPCLILSGLTFGSFLFHLFYYIVPGDLFYLEVNYYYWMLYTTFVVLVILIFTIIPLTGNIICFTALGAYALIFSMDYDVGSNLKYILINGIRRATVSNFNVAVIQPPYQKNDVLLTFLWIFLVIAGLYKQCAYSSNRAPYPASASGLNNETERAPLLGGRRYQYRYRSYYSERSA
ncbi:hypothetical protein QAD02_012381 [Eretmocerus hayati]|uniref:Uncharacterized protein n=1 Tax=Eretmocerus hayati TaxID=131215 RepID=A0ACC2P241_9HYME|nr:hypothetical protein QAD02_012381 [Eretmocerus hayati]